jgi:hypothetical protein
MKTVTGYRLPVTGFPYSVSGIQHLASSIQFSIIDSRAPFPNSISELRPSASSRAIRSPAAKAFGDGSRGRQGDKLLKHPLRDKLTIADSRFATHD